MAQPVRRARVAEQVHHELSEILQRDMNDPRMGWVTVTRVEMSPDLGHAKVFVSVFGDEKTQEITLRVVQRATAHVRGLLGRRVRLRQVPELQFKLDHSLEHGQRIMDILRETEIPPAPPEDSEGEG